MKKPWMKNGKPLLIDGKPMLCEECPCGEPLECSEQVTSYLNARYAELDQITGLPVWSYVGSYVADFQCSIWQEESTSDSEAEAVWNWIQPSNGHLLVVIPRMITPIDTMAYTSYTTYITATEIYNASTGEHRVVGCACRFNTSTYQCELKFKVSVWASVAGLCSVKKPVEIEASNSASDSSYIPEYEYTVNDVCDVELCDRLKLTLTAWYNWHGGCLNGEGYTDRWKNNIPDWWWSDYDWSNWNYYYDFSKHLMIWRFYYNGTWYFAKIPCPCDSIITGTRDFMVHDLSGICNLDGDCFIRMLMWVRHYVDAVPTIEESESTYTCGDESNGLWEEVAGASGDYQCATWEKDGNNEWQLIQPASGNLVMAYTRKNTTYPVIYASAMQYEYEHSARNEKFYHAITLRNRETGVFKTLGCQCYYNTSERTCEEYFVDMDNMCIGGTLPAFPDGQYDYQTICAVDKCQAQAQYFALLGQWYTGTSAGECIIDNVTETAYSATWSYSPFRQGFTWNDNGTKYAIILDCECNENNYMSNWWYLPATELGQQRELCPAQGICNAECQKLEALKASASKRQWINHGAGILMHKRYRGSGTPEYLPYLDAFTGNRLGYNGASLLIVESPTAFFGIGCNCTPSDSASQYKCYSQLKSDHGDEMEYFENDAPAGFWQVLPWNVEDNCSCIDERKLLLDYPDLFGVTDVSYGSNTTYDYTATEITYNAMAEEIEVTYTGNYIVQRANKTNAGDKYFVDYRTICFIMHTFDSKKQLIWISPEGSPFASNTEQYYNNNSWYAVYYDDISFTGHHPLFTRFNFTGYNSSGSIDFAGNAVYYMGYASMCNETADCNDMAMNSACYNSSYDGKTPYQRAVEFSQKTCHYDKAFRSSQNLGTWYFPYVDFNGNECKTQTSKVEQNSSGYWCGYKEIWVKGACTGGLEGSTPVEKQFVYWMQYMQTNKGIAVNGVNGFHATFTQKEAGDHQTFCNASDYSSYHDTTITAQKLDEDMHWCAGNMPDESDSISV